MCFPGRTASTDTCFCSTCWTTGQNLYFPTTSSCSTFASRFPSEKTTGAHRKPPSPDRASNREICNRHFYKKRWQQSPKKSGPKYNLPRLPKNRKLICVVGPSFRLIRSDYFIFLSVLLLTFLKILILVLLLGSQITRLWLGVRKRFFSSFTAEGP